MNKDEWLSSSGGIHEYAAYIPCYDGGNSVTAVKKDGHTILINKSIKYVISVLLKNVSIDISFLRKNFKDYAGSTNLMPLPLGLGTVLIPVKVRKAIGVNDGSFAYINLSFIQDIIEDKNIIIRLKCGYEINCLESAKTIKNRIKAGRVVEEKFSTLMFGEYGLKEGASSIRSEYDKVATKGDITMLAYEIMKLRKKFE